MSERLTSLGIMGTQLRTPLPDTPQTSQSTMLPRGLRGTADVLFFQSGFRGGNFYRSEFYILFSRKSTEISANISVPPPAKNSDQTHSCPRNWHLSVSWRPDWRTPEIPRISQHYIVLMGLRGALNWALIMPRDVSLLNSQCTFFSVWVHFSPDWGNLRTSRPNGRPIEEFDTQTNKICLSSLEDKKTKFIAILLQEHSYCIIAI